MSVTFTEINSNYEERLKRDRAVIAKNIKYYRKKLGLLQTDLAARIGISLATLRRWEAGEIRPKSSTMEKLSEVLRCTVNDLMADVRRDEKSIIKNSSDNNQKSYDLESQVLMLTYEDKDRKFSLPATEEGYKIFRELIQMNNKPNVD